MSHSKERFHLSLLLNFTLVKANMIKLAFTNVNILIIGENNDR